MPLAFSHAPLKFIDTRCGCRRFLSPIVALTYIEKRGTKITADYGYYSGKNLKFLGSRDWMITFLI